MTPPSPESTPLTADPFSDAEIQSALDALSAGEVVGLPTETVYGLAVRADQDGALLRLGAVTGRTETPGGAFACHTAQPAPYLAGAELGSIAHRLAARYWPGPLTLILRAAQGPGAFEGLEALEVDGWTGLRIPSHAGTAAVLDAAPFPIVVAAAARGAEAPATRAADVRSAFSTEDVPLILDGGPASLETPSTVLAIGPGRFEILREGIVSAEELRRAAGLSILFVCTGNTCRSPMAEGIARAALRGALSTEDETSFGFQVASAGVYAGVGSPPSEHAVTALGDRGIDLSRHGSRPAIDREVAEADRVYCLTRSHRAALLAMLPPSAADRVELLDPAGRDVPDPFGGPLEVYRQTADVIEGFIQERLSGWV